MAKQNLHKLSYRPTEYNTDLLADIFQCPNLMCGCQVTGVKFAESNTVGKQYVKCPRCSDTYIKDFTQVNHCPR